MHMAWLNGSRTLPVLKSAWNLQPHITALLIMLAIDAVLTGPQKYLSHLEAVVDKIYSKSLHLQMCIGNWNYFSFSLSRHTGIWELNDAVGSKYSICAHMWHFEQVGFECWEPRLCCIRMQVSACESCLHVRFLISASSVFVTFPTSGVKSHRKYFLDKNVLYHLFAEGLHILKRPLIYVSLSQLRSQGLSSNKCWWVRRYSSRVPLSQSKGSKTCWGKHAMCLLARFWTNTVLFNFFGFMPWLCTLQALGIVSSILT